MQASVAAEKAATSFMDVQNEDSEPLKKEEKAEDTASEKESEDENEIKRKSALEKLENASEESFLGQASVCCIYWCNLSNWISNWQC